MNSKLLLEAADLIEGLALGRFSQLSSRYDIAAHICSAAGYDVGKWIDQENKPGPFSDQAEKLALLPDARLLYICSWPEHWKREEAAIWRYASRRKQPPEPPELAALAAAAVRDYVETGGWV